MKKAKKILLLVLCAALLVGATIAGTVAYLTSEAEVKNTFTVGQVNITMDESEVDEYGVPNGTNRNNGNEYLLVPGNTYTKDPVIYVADNSETCYVFIEITNNIADYIDVADLEEQLDANGWTALEDGVWYQLYTKNQADKELEVFESFTVNTGADSVDGWENLSANLDVVAYAIQQANGSGVFTPAEAWAIVNA